MMMLIKKIKQTKSTTGFFGVSFTMNRQKNDNSSKLKDSANKPHIVAFKYSNNKKGPLHESVILAGQPMFLNMKTDRLVLLNK
jgi:hypothetical protein